MNIYLAGPMRGIPEFNFPKFMEVAAALAKAGHAVANPAQHDIDAKLVDIESCDFRAGVVNEAIDLRKSLAWDLQMLTSWADAIVLLPGWPDSQGASLERQVAEMLGLRIGHWATSIGLWWEDENQDTAETWLPKYFDTPVPATPPPLVDHPGVPDAWDDHKAHLKLYHDMAERMRTAEVRVVDPVTGGAKGSKLARYDLIPYDALTEVAEHFGRGAAKYEDRNWEKGYAWSLSHAALQRHLALFWQGEDYDEGDEATGEFPHLAAVAFHALALLAFWLRGSGTDDRSVYTRPEGRVR